MSILQELFARSWYVGLAVTPVLWLACRYLRTRRAPARRHAVGVAVLFAVLVSTCLPIVRDPGVLLRQARQEFKSAGLAPCRGKASAPPPRCLTMQHAGTWGLGSALLIAWFGLGCIGAHRLRRRARPVPDGIRREVAAVAAELGQRCPALGRLDGHDGPMVVGCLDPLLLLPVSLWDALDPAARAAVLRHELAHLRRHDVLTQGLAHLARAFFWWHPLVWWLRRELARSAERAADALAVAGRPDHAAALGRALLAIEGRGVRPAAPGAVHALSPAARDLADRLDELLGGRPQAGASPRAALAFAAVVAIGWSALQVALG